MVREGERGSRMFVVLSGRLEVRREFAPGRSEPVARLGAGEAFGEVALLEDGVRTRSVRALTACVLLALERADFERLVLSQMSREAVARAVQITGFLQQTELTRGWSPALRAALAARMRVREAPAGSVLVEEGRDNLWFFVVRRGELAVRQGRRELRRLQPGESFGELSLLRDGKATATVVVVSRLASCLVVNGREFLDLVTRDCAAAMQWEEQRKQPREEAGRRRAPQAWW